MAVNQSHTENRRGVLIPNGERCLRGITACCRRRGDEGDRHRSSQDLSESGTLPPFLGAALLLRAWVGEVSDDIHQVTAPKGQDSLLLGNIDHAVYNALVLLICSDLLAGMLHL
uniref:Uncharacterized protein n=1 Tax=Theropithecus gelada TaxID=9565 RepID=A0A8D2EMT6_THEGE